MSSNPTGIPTVLVGFWRVDGVEHSNETKLSGNGLRDKELLLVDIKKQHPSAKEILSLGTRIEQRTPETAFIEVTPGAVLRNIFDGPDGKEDPIRNVGDVWFSGAPYEVVLMHSRAQGCVLVRLQPRLASTGPVKFSNQLNPQRLLTELPNLLAEVFGSDARALRLNIRERANKTPNPEK
jgi:hypothetical protein